MGYLGDEDRKTMKVRKILEEMGVDVNGVVEERGSVRRDERD